MEYWHVYVGLGLATTGYAALLEWLKRRWPKIEPDWTWVEVSIGTAIVLAAPYILEGAQLTRTIREGRHAHWIAFLVGGTPIALWQIWRMSHRHQETIEVAHEEANGNGTITHDKDESLATQSALGAGGKRRPRRRHQRPSEPGHGQAGEGDRPDPEQP